MIKKSLSLVQITRLCVYVHPGQLKEGLVHLVVFDDSDKERFSYLVDKWKDDICVYDGPPLGKFNELTEQDFSQYLKESKND